VTPADLEAVVARTGHERFRWLTSDANPNPAHRDAYRKLVARLARGEPAPNPTPPPPKTVPLADALRARKLGLARCVYASKPACSCQGAARCHHLGRIVSIRDCLDCLKP
jgi:hypothetical protein